MLKATPAKVDKTILEATRSWLHSYMLKFGREKNAHPPDDHIVAQFLAVAKASQLDRLLYDLMAERKQPGYSYAWFVTVALQRIHGISPQAQKQRRESLRIVPREAAAPPPPAVQESFDIQADIQADIQKLAHAKRMRR